jgi:DNA-binding MarR family transcriptional regulator
MSRPLPDNPKSEDLVDEVVAGFASERPDLDAVAIETACRLIYAGRKMEQRAVTVLKPFGLNYTDLDVMGTLRRSGPTYELSPADLIRSAMITSGAMTVCLNRLERAGMISRRVSPDDRRVRIIRLTPKGRQLIDKVLTARFGDAKEILSHLSGKEIASLNTLLRSAVSKT